MLEWFRSNIDTYNFSMEKLYKIAGITRQGFHQKKRKREQDALFYQRLKESVIAIRKDHPRIGARKLFVVLDLKGKIGVNRFEKYLAGQGLGIQVKRSTQKTTNSNHAWQKYNNLLYGFKLTGANQVWASDITYYMSKDNVYYITFIEDLFSRRILAYSVSDNMLHDNNVKVLKKSLSVRKGSNLSNLIHHSDKGSQYCSLNYIDILKSNNIKISMAENSMENGYVERLNGILKNDYLYPRNKAHDLKSLKRELDIVVKLYNEKRPHSELGNMSPKEFEEKQKSAENNKFETVLFDFKKHNEDRFLKALAKRMDTEKLPTDSNTVGNNHSHRSSYSLESCSSAELSSALLDGTNI